MLALVAWLALAQAAPGAPPAPPRTAQAPSAELARERALASTVEPARMQALVRDLCAFGARIGGSDSNRRAAEHLREAFEQAGLEARLIEDPETWCHEERSWELALVRPGLERVALASAWPLGFSPAGEGEAALSLEARGGGAWIGKRVRRVREGAEVALLLIDGSTTTDGAWPVVFELGQPGAETRAVFALSRSEGELVRAAAAAGDARVAWRLDASVFRGRPLTVEARLAPREGAHEPGILFCAHGDSDAGGPGANDNGSGEAIVLEIARAWSAAIRSGALPPPERELRFAVWGREIHSSEAWLEREREAQRLPALVLNFDQSGYGSLDDRLHLEPDDDPLALALVEHYEALLEAHDERAAGLPPPEQLLPARWSTNRGLGGTDAYVFSRDEGFRARGGAAVTLYASAWGSPRELERTPGRRGASFLAADSPEKLSIDCDLHYHSAGDTPQNTTEREPWNMAWCARAGWLVALRWLASAR